MIIRHFAALNIGFATNYTAHEFENGTEVCVQLLTGYLGTDVTLQLTTFGVTAEGNSV